MTSEINSTLNVIKNVHAWTRMEGQRRAWISITIASSGKRSCLNDRQLQNPLKVCMFMTHTHNSEVRPRALTNAPNRYGMP